MSTDNPFAYLYGPIYGSLFFCIVMTSTFYGVTCVQTFCYYVHYQKDPWSLKIFVAAIWALNTIHEVLIISGTYKYFMAGWLNGPVALVVGPPELAIVSLFTTTAAILTQGYFVHRLYIFSGNNIVVPLIWALLAITQLGSVLTDIIIALPDGIQPINYMTLYNHTFNIVSTLCLASAAGVDVLISCVLTFLLLRKRTVTKFARTANIIQRLTVFAVSTGVWPATFALLAIILMQAFPDSMYYAIFGIPLGSVYCNTLLANLNGRSYVRGEATADDVSEDWFGSSAGAPVFATFKTDQQHRDQGIWKTTEVMQLSDAPGSTKPENV